MSGRTEAAVHEAVKDRLDVDASGWDFLTMADQHEALRADVEKIRTCPLIPGGTLVAGFVFDVVTGGLEEVVAPAPS